MSTSTTNAAQDIARGVETHSVGTVSFVEILPLIIPVIQGLMQLFQSCNNKDQTPEKKLQKYVSDRYNQSKDEYDRVLFARTLRRVTHEAKNQQKQYTPQQLKLIARQTLDRARAATQEDLENVYTESVNSPSVLFNFED